MAAFSVSKAATSTEIRGISGTRLGLGGSACLCTHREDATTGGELDLRAVVVLRVLGEGEGLGEDLLVEALRHAVDLDDDEAVPDPGFELLLRQRPDGSCGGGGWGRAQQGRRLRPRGGVRIGSGATQEMGQAPGVGGHATRRWRRLPWPNSKLLTGPDSAVV